MAQPKRERGCFRCPGTLFEPYLSGFNIVFELIYKNNRAWTFDNLCKFTWLAFFGLSNAGLCGHQWRTLEISDGGGVVLSRPHLVASSLIRYTKTQRIFSNASPFIRVIFYKINYNCCLKLDSTIDSPSPLRSPRYFSFFAVHIVA